MRSTIAFLVALMVIMMITACKGNDNPDKPASGKQINDGQPEFVKEGELTFLDASGKELTRINIEIADTPDEQQRGLMNRSFMANNQGMLFIFDTEEQQGFWMKNTIIPLDIMYVNSARQIVSIAENTQPFSETSIPSKGRAQYVVEVNAGFSAQYGIQPGFTVQWTRL